MRRVFELWNQGLSKKAIARETGVSRTQVRGWLARGLEDTLDSPMRRTSEAQGEPCDLYCGLRDGLTQISIARRESVARLDSFVGPKS